MLWSSKWMPGEQDKSDSLIFAIPSRLRPSICCCSRSLAKSRSAYNCWKLGSGADLVFQRAFPAHSFLITASYMYFTLACSVRYTLGPCGANFVMVSRSSWRASTTEQFSYQKPLQSQTLKCWRNLKHGSSIGEGWTSCHTSTLFRLLIRALGNVSISSTLFRVSS